VHRVAHQRNFSADVGFAWHAVAVANTGHPDFVIFSRATRDRCAIFESIR